jgi:phosphohistidine swiveling domain-containing protein
MHTKVKKWSHLAKKEWYIQGFNATPNLIYFGITSGIIGLHKNVGYGYSAKIHHYKNDYLDYYYAMEDLEKIGKKLITFYQKDKNYIKNLIKKDETDFKEIFSFYRYLDSINLLKTPTRKLIQLYQKAFVYYDMILSRAHIIEGFSLIYDVKIKQNIEQQLIKKKISKKPHEAFTVLTTTDKGSFMMEEGKELMHIVKEINQHPGLLKVFGDKDIEAIKKTLKKYSKVKNMLHRHQRKFFWIQNNFTGARVLEVDDFIVEIKKMIRDKFDPELYIMTQKRKKINLSKDKKNLLGQLTKDTANMLKLTSELTLWQDDRKKNFLITISYFDRLLLEITKRFGIKENLARYLLPFEIDKKTLGNIRESILRGRKKSSILICERKGKVIQKEILTGEDCQNYLKLLNRPKAEEVKELHGMCASPGRAVGKARICKSLDDITNFKPGEVLVAAMTRPEYLPAMKKAAAIVTDEGGITSHAAIVSRELGIPCIIGTKIATKALKNGNTIQVNANHGVVIILD